jgi:3-oxoacyl-[acyl-carrier protein] reductase
VPDTLRRREIVVAGGSGGLGEAVVDGLLAEGARVVVSYRVRGERAERWRGKAELLQADLIDKGDRARLLDAAPSLYGVVVMAGNPSRYAGAEEVEAAMRTSHDANYAGPVLLAREAAERMKAAGTPGAIVLVSTMQANALFTGSTVYAAQKAALQHAAGILAKELRGESGVRVNVVSPGVIAAGMAKASIASGKYDRYISAGVIARFGKAEDVARAVRLFLEPDNYITGQTLCVDGGMTL